jgi:hypothetical protein
MVRKVSLSAACQVSWIEQAGGIRLARVCIGGIESKGSWCAVMERKPRMSAYVERLVARLRQGEVDLTREVAEQPQRWRYRVERGCVWFDKEARRAHRLLKQSVLAYIREGSLLSFVTAPVIYSLILPLAVLDLWVSAYQWICFPIYGIARVRRRAYFAVDRRKLGYLNVIEKVGCTFCSYANGLISYVREVAARTEQYWCPIRHAQTIPTPHGRYHLFFDYDDAKSYRGDLTVLRRTLRPADDGRSNDGSAHDRP